MTNSLNELEEEIIGTCLTTTGAIKQVATILSSSDCFSGPYKKVYDTMLGLLGDNKETDIVLTNYNLVKNYGPNYSAKQPWMMILTATIPAAKRSTGNLLHKCMLLYQENIRTRFAQELSDALVRSQDVQEDPLQLMDGLRAWLDKTSSGLSELSEKPYSSTLKDVVDRAEQASINRNPITGIPSLLADFDAFTKGYQPGTLNILAARPGMGKTAVACQIAYNVAYEQNIPVAFFSLEMSKESLAARMLAIDTGIKNGHITAGCDSFGDPVNIPKLRDSEQRQGKAPFFIFDKIRTLPQLKAKVSQLVSRHGSKLLVIIDYLQLLKTGTKMDMDITARVSECSRELKEMSISYNIPVEALAQLNREVEKREDKRPKLSDLNHSGSIEQDADTISFLYSPGYYSKTDAEGYPIDMDLLYKIIGKNRSGSFHKEGEAISLKYDRSTNQVKNYNQQQQTF